MRIEIRREMKLSETERSTSGVKFRPLSDDDFSMLEATIVGPPDTPYSGGVFDLTIIIPTKFPFDPPEVSFKTHVWHPNVGAISGTVCVDTLQKRWKPETSIRTVLITVRSLLASPNSDSPQDLDVGRQHVGNPSLFEETAKFWAQKFAGAPGEMNKEKLEAVASVVSSGYSENKAIHALSTTNWICVQAIQKIRDESRRRASAGGWQLDVELMND